MLTAPFLQELEPAQNVLIAGIGGGFDVFSGLPLYFGLQQVTVDFAARGSATLVTITHSRIETEAQRRQHELGWVGCLAGLARFVASPS